MLQNLLRLKTEEEKEKQLGWIFTNDHFIVSSFPLKNYRIIRISLCYKMRINYISLGLSYSERSQLFFLYHIRLNMCKNYVFIGSLIT